MIAAAVAAAAHLGRGMVDLLLPPRCPACLSPTARPTWCDPCRAAFDWVRPPWCPTCGIPFPGDADSHRCADCRARRPAFRSARSLLAYRSGPVGDPLPATIRRLKYAGELSAAPALATLLCESVPTLFPGGHDAVIPVPLHRSRLRQRGFNQAILLAAPLANRLSVPLLPRHLRRVRATASQTSLAPGQRRENVRDAFAAAAVPELAGAAVLLVDDVFTTGATADACSRALLASGASSVDVVTVARALPD